MYTVINDIFEILNSQDSHVVIMAVMIIIATITVLLRIFTHVHFRGVLMSFRKDAKKEIKSLDDLKKLNCALLKKVVAEYKQVADIAVTHAPTGQLVQKHLSQMSFMGWQYDGMLPFIVEMERAMLWIGLILAVVFGEFAFVYGMLAIILFLITKVAAAFFNFHGAREQLAGDITIYIEREVGRFYASDTGGAVLRLKNDLTGAVASMTSNLENIMGAIADSLAKTTNSIGKTMADTTKSIGKTMTETTLAVGPALANAMDEKLINMNESLTHTLNSWEKALGEAVSLQTTMNDTSDKLGQSSLRLQSSADLLAKHLQGHSSALSEQLVALVSAIEAVQNGIETMNTQQEALTHQTSYIERNQQTLEAALQAYESSLQGLTQSLGDGLGAFINLHAQTSAQAVNDALKTNLEKIMQLATRSE